MTHSTKPTDFETQTQDMENGFNTFPLPNAQLTFGRQTLTPGEVVQQLQAILAVLQEVRTTDLAHQAAVKACEKQMPAAHAFYDQAVTVVRAHFGSDPKVLATFGLGEPRKHRAQPRVVIEELFLDPPEEVVVVATEPPLVERKPRRHRARPPRGGTSPRGGKRP